jgi:hypothetical protein
VCQSLRQGSARCNASGDLLDTLAAYDWIWHTGGAKGGDSLRSPGHTSRPRRTVTHARGSRGVRAGRRSLSLYVHRVWSAWLTMSLRRLALRPTIQLDAPSLPQDSLVCVAVGAGATTR